MAGTHLSPPARLCSSLVHFVVSMCHTRQAALVPWSLSLPDRSESWHRAELRHLVKRHGARTVTSDMCAIGSRWRQPLKLAGGRIELGSVKARCCPRRNQCSFTGARHAPEQGRTHGSRR